MIDKSDNYIVDISGHKVCVNNTTVWDTISRPCPTCGREGFFQTYTSITRDFETDEILYTHQKIYCAHGCEIDPTQGMPILDTESLKREIMNSRAMHLENSIEVFNKCEDGYLFGFNCLYVHFQPVNNGEYSVFYDYYLEYRYEERAHDVGKKEMRIEKTKPDARKIKELLYQWMVERFEQLSKTALKDKNKEKGD